MDTAYAANMDDAELRQLVVKNAHHSVEKDRVWEVLLAPELVERTREALSAVYNQSMASMSRRRQEREQFQHECFVRGEAGKAEWFATKADYERERGRQASLHKALQSRLADAGKALKDRNRARSVELSAQPRESLRKLATAVRKHQAAHARSGTPAEQCDYELWQLLDRLTVPVGPNSEQVTLRTMLDYYWTDVEPVTAAQAAVEALEPMVRSAPEGGAQSFAGGSRARHVGSDRRQLAGWESADRTG